jgi:hypothetical protein
MNEPLLDAGEEVIRLNELKIIFNDLQVINYMGIEEEDIEFLSWEHERGQY